MRSALTPDRLLAALCVAVAIAMATPWVQVPVMQLADRSVSYSVPDLLGAGHVVVDRA